MADPKRSQVVYVTADGSQWMRVDVPFGLITPPTLTFHKPLAGPVEFFYAECYGLPIPQEARESSRG